MEQTEEKTYRIEKCDSKVQWDEFVLEHGGHPMQLWGWGDARATLGWLVDRLFVVEDDKQLGAAQILIKKLPRPFGLCLYVPRGPLVVTNETAVYERLITYVKETYHGVALIVEPHDENDPAGTGWRESDIPALAPKTIILELEKADGVLLADIDKLSREHIRTAGQANLTVKKLGNPEDITACYGLYKDSCSHRGEKPYKEKYFHDLQDKLGEFSVLFGAYENETLVSFLWLMTSETVAVELYDGISARGLELSAQYGLRWEAIRRIKQWGVAGYDLGGVNPQDDKDQKRGFGGQITERGTFVLPMSAFYSLWNRAGRNRGRYAK